MKSTSGDYAVYYPPNAPFYQAQPDMGFVFPMNGNMNIVPPPQNSYSMAQFGMSPYANPTNVATLQARDFQANQALNAADLGTLSAHSSVANYGSRTGQISMNTTSVHQTGTNNNMIQPSVSPSLTAGSSSAAALLNAPGAYATGSSAAYMGNGGTSNMNDNSTNAIVGGGDRSIPGMGINIGIQPSNAHSQMAAQLSKDMYWSHEAAAAAAMAAYMPGASATSGNPQQTGMISSHAPVAGGQTHILPVSSGASTLGMNSIPGQHHTGQTGTTIQPTQANHATSSALNDMYMAAMMSTLPPNSLLGNIPPSTLNAAIQNANATNAGLGGANAGTGYTLSGAPHPSHNQSAAALAAMGLTAPNLADASGAAGLTNPMSNGPSNFDFSSFTYMAPPGSSAVGPSGMTGRQTTMPNLLDVNSCESEHFRVAKKHCGRIIGKGGVRIKEMEDKHQCKVQIHSQEQPMQGTISITITGPAWARSQCWATIQEIVKESERREQQQQQGPTTNSIFETNSSATFSDQYNSQIAPLLSSSDLNGCNNNVANIAAMAAAGFINNGNNVAQHQAANSSIDNVGITNIFDPMMSYSNSWNGLPAANQANGFNELTMLNASFTNSIYEQNLAAQFTNLMRSSAAAGTSQQQQQQQHRNNYSYTATNNSFRRKVPVDCNQYPVNKNFYNEEPSVNAMTPVQRKEILLRQNNIIVCGISSDPNIPYPHRICNPVEDFVQAYRDYPEILEFLSRQNFFKPTPIQCMAWPILLSGLDFIGVAQTGSGKTLAYLLPALIHVEGQRKPRINRAGPTVLILAPTRELTIQIQTEINRYPYRGIRCISVYGGADRKRQYQNLLNFNPEIVVATPGRLTDLMNDNKLDLSDVTYCVLDEADRMLDMGFEPQVIQILAPIRKDRQTVMTTATWSQPIDNLAQKYMKDPVRVNVGSLELNVCQDVRQIVEHIREENRWQWLYSFLSMEFQPQIHKALIFVGRKLDCSQMAQNIAQIPNMPSTTCIHGDMDQNAREEALGLLRSGQVRILVATDVASRGLDIHDITHVINYDAPKNAEEYIHRVGRTGRAGRMGTAITLLTDNDYSVGRQIMNVLEQTNQGGNDLTALSNFISSHGNQSNRRRPAAVPMANHYARQSNATGVNNSMRGSCDASGGINGSTVGGVGSSDPSMENGPTDSTTATAANGNGNPTNGVNGAGVSAAPPSSHLYRPDFGGVFDANVYGSGEAGVCGP